MSPLSNPGPHQHPPKASALLEELLDAFPGEEQVTVDEIMAKLERRAFGLLLLLLALPNCIPNLPGLSTMILAGVLILPIPFGNWPPGMAIAALALGFLQRDGVAAIVSFGFFIASLVIAPLGIGMGLAALAWLGRAIGNGITDLLAMIPQ